MTSAVSLGMAERCVMSSGTVDVLVSVVLLSFIAVIVDKFTGFLVDWVALGYI